MNINQEIEQVRNNIVSVINNSNSKALDPISRLLYWVVEIYFPRKSINMFSR